MGGDHFLCDCGFILLERFGNAGKTGPQGGLCVLGRQGFRPIQGEVEGAAAVIDLMHLARGGFGVFKIFADCLIQGFRENLGLVVPGVGGDQLKRGDEGAVFAQGVPAEVAFFEELLHVLGGRAAGTGLEEAAAFHQRDDREHPGAGPEFENREQVGQIVSQHIAGHGNRIFASANPFQGKPHPGLRLHDANIKTGGVVLRQIAVDFFDYFRVMPSALVQPENRGRTGRFGSGDRQPDPVADRRVLGLAHSEDVPAFDRLLQKGGAGTVHNANRSGRGCFKRFVVRPVLFGFLGHQADVGNAAHGRRVELSVLFGVFQDFFVYGGVAPVRYHGDGVLQLVLCIPHPAPIAHDIRHGGVNDDVIGHVEVGRASA